MRPKAFRVSPLVFAFGLALALPGTAAAQKAVVVVRHAENKGDALTEAGAARARRLAAVLANAGVGAIYATDTKRTIGTATPLAEARGLKVQLYDVGDSERGVDARPFAAMLKAAHPGDVVLVVGHSNTVPEILTALGCTEEVAIAPREHDDLFVVVPKAGGGATLVRLTY
jgi:broad specificity phosphatase PhoE